MGIKEASKQKYKGKKDDTENTTTQNKSKT